MSEGITPNELERNYGEVVYSNLQLAHTPEMGADFIAKALAAHRERTQDTAVSEFAQLRERCEKLSTQVLAADKRAVALERELQRARSDYERRFEALKEALDTPEQRELVAMADRALAELDEKRAEIHRMRGDLYGERMLREAAENRPAVLRAAERFLREAGVKRVILSGPPHDWRNFVELGENEIASHDDGSVADTLAEAFRMFNGEPAPAARDL